MSESVQRVITALPDGKSLGQPTFDLLTAARFDVRRKHPRATTGELWGLPGLRDLVFVKPSQIPHLVAEAVVQLGITGMDTVVENGANVKIVTSLRYARSTDASTACVVFAPKNGLTMLLSGGTKPYRIVSEYPNATEKYLQQQGINAEVTACTGGAEALVAQRLYDAGVALVETGTSLRVNDLHIVARLFPSETVLIANLTCFQGDPAFRARAEFFGCLLKGVLDARAKVLLTMNIPADTLDEVKRVLPSEQSPTITTLADPYFCSVSSVVPVADIIHLKRRLVALGATAIIEQAITSIL